jgi:hypothetical protein
MQFTHSQRGSEEVVEGSFFMIQNEWTIDLGNGLRNMNLKGVIVFLNLDLSFVPAGVRPGLCCAIPSTSANPFSYCAPLGVMTSDMRLGRDPLRSGWITVRQYGFCDRILTPDSTSVTATDAILFTNGINSGFVSGCTYTEFTQNGLAALTGVASIDTAGASPAILNLSGGAGTSVTWGVAPGAASTSVPSTGVPNKNQFIIGYHYLGDTPVQPAEVLEGIVTGGSSAYRQVKGFVSCLGMPSTW